MQGKKKNTKLKRCLQVVWLVYAVLSIVILLPKADDLLCKDYPEVSKHVLLDTDWDITINDQVYTDVSLSELKFPAVEKGDIVTMQRQLPKDWDMVEAALRFHIRHCAVKMYIQGEQVYEYGYERLEANKTVGSGFQFINFPNEYKGKKLKITIFL